MSGETALAARLRADGDLDAIVQGAIYAGRAPLNRAPPFVVWRRVTASGFDALDGTLQIQRGRFQVDCYAKGYDDCVALAAAVRSAVLAAQDWQLFASVIGEADIFEDVEPALWRRMIDFQTMEKI